jgi:hypothetical protein
MVLLRERWQGSCETRLTKDDWTSTANKRRRVALNIVEVAEISSEFTNIPLVTRLQAKESHVRFLGGSVGGHNGVSLLASPPYLHF